MNFTKLLLFSFITTATIFGQSFPAIKIASNAQLPDITTSRDGKVFIGWVQNDSSFTASSGFYTCFDSSANCLIQASNVADLCTAPPSIIPGPNNFLLLWAYYFMEPYPSGCLKNPDGSSIDCHSLGEGYTPQGFLSGDSTYIFAIPLYYAGVQASSYSNGKWQDNVDSLISETISQPAKVNFCPAKNSRVLVWRDGKSPQFNIYARRFSEQNMPISDKFSIVRDTSISEIYSFEAAATPDGSTLISWSGKKNGLWSIFRTLILNSDSLITTTITAADADVAAGSSVAIACNDEGESVIAFEGKNISYLQRFNSQGAAIGSFIPLMKEAGTAFYPAVALWHDKIHAVWTEYASAKNSVWYQVFDFNNPFNAVDNSSDKNNLTRFELSQNYPNPFNPTTTIQYTVTAYGSVNVAVYNVLGKKVATLVNEVKTPGTYSVNFNATDLPSGIYFYKIVSGSFSSTRKMMLVK